jgi:hypothetical protein
VKDRRLKKAKQKWGFEQEKEDTAATAAASAKKPQTRKHTSPNLGLQKDAGKKKVNDRTWKEARLRILARRRRRRR